MDGEPERTRIISKKSCTRVGDIVGVTTDSRDMGGPEAGSTYATVAAESGAASL